MAREITLECGSRITQLTSRLTNCLRVSQARYREGFGITPFIASTLCKCRVARNSLSSDMLVSLRSKLHFVCICGGASLSSDHVAFGSERSLRCRRSTPRYSGAAIRLGSLQAIEVRFFDALTYGGTWKLLFMRQRYKGKGRKILWLEKLRSPIQDERRFNTHPIYQKFRNSVQ